MRKIIFLAIVSILPLALLAQETQIPFIHDPYILEVNKDIQSRLGLFSEYSDFQKAKLYELDEKRFALEIFTYESGQNTKYREILSLQDYEKLIQSIAQRIAYDKRILQFNEGRIPFLIHNTVVSTAYLGTAAVEVLEISDPYITAAIYTAVGSAGFFIPYYLTSELLNVSIAQASLSGLAYLNGFIHGVYINRAFDQNSNNPLRYHGITAPLILTQGFLGYYLAEKMDMTFETTAITGIMALYGTALGTMANELIGIQEHTWLYPVLPVGLSLSAYAGGYLYGLQDVLTVPDIIFTLELMGLGGFTAMNFLSYFDFYLPSDKIQPASFISGTLSGLAASYFIVKDRNFSGEQVGFIGLLQGVGSLLGGGVGFIISPAFSATEGLEEKFIGSMTLLGNYIGLYFGLNLEGPKAKQQPRKSAWSMRGNPYTFNSEGKKVPGLSLQFSF